MEFLWMSYEFGLESLFRQVWYVRGLFPARPPTFESFPHLRYRPLDRLIPPFVPQVFEY
jgi:hypothetical protein